MPKTLPKYSQLQYRKNLLNVCIVFAALAIVAGVFFLGLFAVNRPGFVTKFITPAMAKAEGSKEVFGFAPYWTLNKLNNIDWNVLTTFAYFSLPINANGTIDKTSYEWTVFEGEKLGLLFNKAHDNTVRRVVTLSQMDGSLIREFLTNRESWQTLSNETVEIVGRKGLDGVNIDFEYIPSDNVLREQFSEFIKFYSAELENRLDNPYITVSVLASSERFNKIYDVGTLAKSADAIFIMGYDFYYPDSEQIGPAAPLYGYNDGRGPFWYDVSTAVDDFLAVAPSDKIILGVPYYGWNYPAYSPEPKTDRIIGASAKATTNERSISERLIATTPVGGWDSQAMVSWRGYWDEDGWRVAYLEDKKSLSMKYDFAKEKKLGGVGIWALGFDANNGELWDSLREKYGTN